MCQNMDDTKIEDIYAYIDKIILCSTDVSEKELQYYCYKSINIQKPV